MIGVESIAASEQTHQWIEDGQRQLAVLIRVLSDYDRALDVAETAEKECERLRELLHDDERLRTLLATTKQECDRVHDDMKRLRADIDTDLRSVIEDVKSVERCHRSSIGWIPSAVAALVSLVALGASLYVMVTVFPAPAATPAVSSPNQSLASARVFVLFPDGKVELTNASGERRIFRWDGRQWQTIDSLPGASVSWMPRRVAEEPSSRSLPTTR